MKNLTKYVAGVNLFAGLWGDPLIDINNIDEDTAKRLFHKLDGEMSPENLHCDGEISAAQARQKARLFNGAVRDLKKLGFSVPDDCYGI